MLPLVREMFPGKLMLMVKDIARVLGRTGAGGYEQTREQLANGAIPRQSPVGTSARLLASGVGAVRCRPIGRS